MGREGLSWCMDIMALTPARTPTAFSSHNKRLWELAKQVFLPSCSQPSSYAKILVSNILCPVIMGGRIFKFEGYQVTNKIGLVKYGRDTLIYLKILFCITKFHSTHILECSKNNWEKNQVHCFHGWFKCFSPQEGRVYLY